MISEKYKKAVDIIRANCSLEHDLEKIVVVFQMLIENGDYAGDDDIYQYLIKDVKDNTVTKEFNTSETPYIQASKIQNICETIKATLEPEADHWDIEWLHKELFGE